MEQIFSVVSEQWMQQSLWEVVAVVLAFAYVYLAAKENRWCWPCGFISTGIYTVLFLKVNLPFQSLLNGYYMIMAVYGWWHWRSSREDTRLPVVQWPIKYHGLSLLLLLGLAAAIATLADSWFTSEWIMLDAAVMVFSLFATFLLTQKVAEHWLYWIVIDLFAGYLYWQQGLYLTSVLFFSYFLFSIYGYQQWRKKMPIPVRG